MNLSISRDGVEIGQWTEEQVRTFYKEGQLLPTDHYWKEGMAGWQELGTFIKPPRPALATRTVQTEKPKMASTTKMLPITDDGHKQEVASIPPALLIPKRSNDLEEKKPTHWLIRLLYFFLGAALVKGAFISAHESGGER